MKQLVYLFPGQGAQTVGMGAALVECSARARRVFDRGREVLGWDVLQVCLSGPEDELNSTRVSQPAIFLLSMAVLDHLGGLAGGDEPFGRDLPAEAAAGLSLGEYSALVFSGCLEFEDALRVVGARGELMQEACDLAPGGMTSVIGLDVASVEKVVERAASAGRIGIANYNSPDQTVLSGDKGALDAAAAIATELGAKRTIPLTVAGAYHSPLMASATAKLRPLLEALEIRAPRCAFYSNVHGSVVEDPREIRDGLVRQVESSVRWSAILEALIARGASEALEVGPGRVLKGLARNIDRNFKVSSVCEPESLAELFSKQEGAA